MSKFWTASWCKRKLIGYEMHWSWRRVRKCLLTAVFTDKIWILIIYLFIFKQKRQLTLWMCFVNFKGFQVHWLSSPEWPQRSLVQVSVLWHPPVNVNHASICPVAHQALISGPLVAIDVGRQEFPILMGLLDPTWCQLLFNRTRRSHMTRRGSPHLLLRGESYSWSFK